MRAALLEEIGAPPRPAEAPEPRREPGHALVEVASAALNPIDISIGTGRFYAPASEVPYIPGKEGVGRVIESDSLPVGARVYFPMPGGLGGPGALAERAAADESAAIEVPDGVDDATAVCLGVAGLAAWLPLEWRARLQGNETVLVLGASGPVGQIAVQAARLLGAGRVVAAARSPAGLEQARELGADATVSLEDPSDPERLGEAFVDAAGGQIDVTIDPLWGTPAVAAAHAAAHGGRIIQVGQSAGSEAAMPSAPVRSKLLEIRGHTNLAAPQEQVASAYRRMAEHAAAGRLRVELETVALDEVTEAWRRQAEFPRRKLVVVP